MPILIVSDPQTGTSQRIEIDDARLRPLIGTRIGVELDGAVAELQGYKIKFTGGTDKDGIPMRPDVHGSAKSAIILTEGVGYHTKIKGQRKRKVVRGNIISAETTFLNFVITEAPKKKKAKEEPAPEPEDTESEPEDEGY
jgi:small subunit ribosomal protein S6e